ncbi:MAG: FKBP-type peptidyl-prolyl cis-trans isomerase [Clostridia bacterium]|nr:FKBP-type peptidyl-prolyl cis-trans isomerase [Clostridia bacterium]
MKRIVALVLLLALSLSVFTACGKKKKANFDLESTADAAFDYYHADLSAYLSISREDYASLTVSLDVTDTEVDEYLNDHLLPSYRTPNLYTDQAVQNGDTVYIRYTGYIDGVAFEGGSNADDDRAYGLEIGSNSFIDTFETQLIGVIPNQTSWESPKVVNVTFPADYKNADLAGKAAKFDVVIEGIFDGTYTVPELTPEFARNINNFTPETDDPVSEFKLALKDWMRENKAASLESRKFSCLMDKLLATVSFTGKFPEGEIKRLESVMNDTVLSYYQQANFYYYMQYGIVYYDSMDSAARDYYGLRFDADWETYQTVASAKVVKQMLILNMIARLEGFTISEDEIKDWVLEEVEAANKSQQSEDATPESVLAEHSLEEIYAEIAAQKAQEFLMGKVTFDTTGLPID